MLCNKKKINLCCQIKKNKKKDNKIKISWDYKKISLTKTDYQFIY